MTPTRFVKSPRAMCAAVMVLVRINPPFMVVVADTAPPVQAFTIVRRFIIFPPLEFVQLYPLSQFALLAFTVDVTASAVDFAVFAVL